MHRDPLPDHLKKYNFNHYLFYLKIIIRWTYNKWWWVSITSSTRCIHRDLSLKEEKRGEKSSERCDTKRLGTRIKQVDNDNQSMFPSDHGRNEDGWIDKEWNGEWDWFSTDLDGMKCEIIPSIWSLHYTRSRCKIHIVTTQQTGNWVREEGGISPLGSTLQWF